MRFRGTKCTDGGGDGDGDDGGDDDNNKYSARSMVIHLTSVHNVSWQLEHVTTGTVLAITR